MTPSTEIVFRYNPETHELVADVDRDWLAGPLDADAEVSVTRPDGTAIHAKLTWKSTVDLDPAQAAEIERQKTNTSMIELAREVISRAPIVPPQP